jgi:hypothetical protein
MKIFCFAVMIWDCVLRVTISSLCMGNLQNYSVLHSFMTVMWIRHEVYMKHKKIDRNNLIRCFHFIFCVYTCKNWEARKKLQSNKQRYMNDIDSEIRAFCDCHNNYFTCPSSSTSFFFYYKNLSNLYTYIFLWIKITQQKIIKYHF